MTEKPILSVDGGSETYWQKRRRAFRLIRNAELAAQRVKTAPLYLHGGHDENGDVIPVENIEPWDDLGNAMAALEADATALSILAAQGRTHIGGHAVAGVASSQDAD
ncbi:hypothetical protein [Paracoccus shandongensis]|uniref:hypothetical protein n=1 Tax=Paracoccus shandongensis TaxID=2816048 RepID=UPI001A903C21|nr:hypothetical protein [Paracoccus shandongensis]